MANTEVGTAWVTIIPSARGFAKELQKAIAKEFRGSNLDRLISDALAGARVTIPARAELDTSDIPDQIRGQEPELPVRLDPLMAAFEDELRRELVANQVTVDVPARADTDGLRSEITAAVAQVEQTVSAGIDTEPAGAGEYGRDLRTMVAAVARGVRATVRAEVKVDPPKPGELTQRINVDAEGQRLGNRIGESSGRGFLSSFGSTIRSLTGTSPIIIAAGAAIGGALLPAVSAGLTGGLLGGAGLGLIGLGAFILREQQDVQNAAWRLADRVKYVFQDAAAPLIEPFVEALDTVRWAVIEWGPQFKTMFELIAPAIQPLTEGLIGMVSNMLPGFTELIRQATPFLISLADQLPRLGQYIGAFFKIIDGGGPEASLFFSDLITIVGGVILAFGAIIRVATELYPVFRTMGLVVLGLIGVVWTARDAVTEFGHRVHAVIDRVVAIVSAAFRSMRTEPEMWVRWITAVPNRILRSLGDLGGLLRGVGRAIMRGLVDGIRSMFGALESSLRWVTNRIPDWKGPMDRDRRLLEPSGAAIMGGLIRGIHGERSALQAELGSVTALVAGTPLTSPAAGFGTPAAAGVYPAAPTIRFEGDAPGSFMAWVKENIRTDFGGDPVAALGSR